MTNAIANRPDPMPMTLNDTMTLGKVLAESGFFKDTRSAAQAVAKVLAGRELGFGPMASMTGVYVIEGSISLSATLMAAAVKGSGKYNYRVRKWDEDSCDLEFFEDGQSVGHSVFTMKDAAKAELASRPMWKKYPRNMLFARAMSNGAGAYCADVLGGGPIYTPEELGVDVDENGAPTDITAFAREVPEPEPTPEPPRRRVAPPVPREVEAAAVGPDPRQIVWERVKTWASEHGTDPQRFAYYLATDQGVPPTVTPKAMSTWLDANPDKTLGDAYDLYVPGESPQPEPAEQGVLA